MADFVARRQQGRPGPNDLNVCVETHLNFSTSFVSLRQESCLRRELRRCDPHLCRDRHVPRCRERQNAQQREHSIGHPPTKYPSPQYRARRCFEGHGLPKCSRVEFSYKIDWTGMRTNCRRVWPPANPSLLSATAAGVSTLQRITTKFHVRSERTSAGGAKLVVLVGVRRVLGCGRP